MLRALLVRVLQAGAVAVLVATLAFVILQAAPGDPLGALAENPSVTPEVVAAERARLGYDRPVGEQLVRYLGGVARGDLGYSTSTGMPVARVIGAALPNSLVLMGTALALSFAAGIALGVAQAVRPGGLFDRLSGALSLFFYSLPEFWLALVLLVVLAGGLRLFPVGGTATLFVAHDSAWSWLADRLHHLALPVLTLVLVSAAAIARFQRAAMLEVMPDDFVRTAVAKGVPPRRVLLGHVWRNALVPVIALGGLALPALVGGAVFVEQIFAWPGMGRLVVEAIASRDYPLLTGCVLVGGVFVVAGSLLADALTIAADPRQRGRSPERLA